MQKSVWGFVLGVCIGGLVGWRSFATASHDPQQNSARVTRSAHVSSERDDRPVWTESDFTNDALRNRELYFGSKERGLENWSLAELRAALEDSLHDPQCIGSTSIYGGGEAASILLGEWMKRDLDAALAWFEQVQPDTARERLAAALDVVWPKAEAERGLAYLREHPELKGRGNSYILNQAALLSAQRGAASLAEFLEKATPEERRYLGSTWQDSFPPGFDFTALMGSKAMQEMLDERQGYPLLRMWQKQNPDQAFAYLVENGRSNMILGMVRSITLNNREATTAWLGSKIDALDEATRTNIIDEAKQSMTYDPALLRAIADNSRDPALQENLRREGLQLMYRGNVGEALKFLDKMALPSQRIEMIESLTSSQENINKRASLSTRSQKQLRDKLREWHADDARIDAILGNFNIPSQKEDSE